jgi:hypothetical protein
MRDTSTLYRSAGAAALAACGVLTVTSVLLMPDFSGTGVERLEAVAASSTTAAVSAGTFALAQLPFAVGAAAVVHLLRGRVPVLATVAGVLCLLGAFGHAVHGGVSLTMLTMAADAEHHAVHAEILAAGERSPVLVPFLAMGLLGTVFGVVVLAAALWRGRLGPRWLPAALLAFVVVEFVGTGLSRWAGYGSAALYLLSFLALAALVLRSPLHAWTAPELVTTPEGAQRAPGQAGDRDRAPRSPAAESRSRV